jgi:alpha-mannosidase
LPLRPDPAGPAVPVDGAQVEGLRRWRYGLFLHRGGWEAAHLNERADAFLDPFEVAVGSAAVTGARPAEGRALRVEGALVSSVHRCDDGLVVRLFHPGSQLVSAAIGEPGFPERRVDLRPGEIITVRVGRRPGAG